MATGTSDNPNGLKPVTDPALLKQLNSGGSALKPVTDPSILAKLNATQSPPTEQSPNPPATNGATQAPQEDNSQLAQFFKENPNVTVPKESNLSPAQLETQKQQQGLAPEVKKAADTQAIRTLGDEAVKQGDYRGALKHYSDALAMSNSPDDLVKVAAQKVNIANTLMKTRPEGLTLSQHELDADKFRDDALANVDIALKANPNNSQAWELKASIAQAKGDNAEVSKSLHMANKVRKYPDILQTDANGEISVKPIDQIIQEQHAKMVADYGEAVAGAADIPNMVLSIKNGLTQGGAEYVAGAKQQGQSFVDLAHGNVASGMKNFWGGLLTGSVGATKMGLAGMMAADPPAGYTFMAGLDMADQLTNDNASKIAFSLLESYTPQTSSELWEKSKFFLDQLGGLVLFHKLTGGKTATDPVKTIADLKDGKPTTVGEMQDVGNAVHSVLTNPKSLNLLQSASAQIPGTLKNFPEVAAQIAAIKPEVLNQIRDGVSPENKIAIANLIDQRTAEEQLMKDRGAANKPIHQHNIDALNLQIQKLSGITVDEAPPKPKAEDAEPEPKIPDGFREVPKDELMPADGEHIFNWKGTGKDITNGKITEPNVPEKPSNTGERPSESAPSEEKPAEPPITEEVKAPEEKVIYTSKSGTHNIHQTPEGLQVRDVKGNEVSATTARKYLDEYKSQFDYEKATTTVTDREGNEHDTNAVELARQIGNTPKYIPEDEHSMIEVAIHNVIGKIKGASYRRFGDKNNITMGFAKKWLNNKSSTIDQVAQEAEDFMYGDHDTVNPRITPEDVVDFMHRYTDTDFLKQRNPEHTDLYDAFEKATGFVPSEKVLNLIADKYGKDKESGLEEKPPVPSDEKGAGVGTENIQEGEGQPRTPEQILQELEAAKQQHAAAESDYNKAKTALDKNLQGKQGDLLTGGNEQKLFDDTADMKAKADAAKKTLDTAKEKLDAAQKLADDNLPGQQQIELSPDEQIAKAKEDLRAAKEAAAKLREKNSDKNNPGVVKEPFSDEHLFSKSGEQADADRKVLDAYVDLAKAHIKKGIKTLEDFAKEISEKVSDVITKAWDTAKTATSFEGLKDKWLGDTDVVVHNAEIESHNLQKEIQDTVPREKGEGFRKWKQRWTDVDNAIHIYLDLKRNPEHLAEFYDKLSPEQKRIADLSQNLTDAQKAIADKIAAEYQKVGEQAKEAGVIGNVLENYVARAWNIEGKSATDLASKFKLTSRHSIQRTLQTILEGQANGLDLKVKGATNNLSILKQEIAKVTANKEFIKEGSSIPYDDTDEKLFTTKQIDGYTKIDNPTFKKWTYAGKLDDYSAEEKKLMGKRRDVLVTENGTVLKKEDVYAPDAIAKRLNNILGKSKLQGIPLIDKFTKFNAAIKSSILFSSLFHHLAFTRNHILSGGKNFFDVSSPRAAYKAGLEAIYNAKPEVELLVRNGMTLGKFQDYEENLLESKSKFSKRLDEKGIAPALRKRLLDTYVAQKRFLFEQYGAGLKAIDGINMLNRELRRNPEKDPNEIAKVVANFQNENYGGLNLARMERNPTTQHFMRLLLLASDWTESNLRMAAKAFKGGYEGKFYRGMWTRIFLRGAAINVLANTAMAFMPDKSDKEKEKGLSWTDKMNQRFYKAWKQGNLNWSKVDISPIAHDLGGDPNKDYYFSIFGHYTDPARLVSTIFSDNGGAGLRFFVNKGSVITKLAGSALTAQDWKGEEYTNLNELLGLDDKGTYQRKTTKEKDGKKVVHEVGTPKGGQLEGELTKYAEGGAHPVNATQLPSFALEQLRAMTPTQVSYFLQLWEGETDAFYAIANSIGLGTTKVAIPKDQTPKAKATPR